ncbi:aldo/keto reductase [Paenibacillus sp. MBLB4367]|uniref:aldo/keto reductase n=1 Tax=Paenibacillus sp. MBLB4367 TaxID=3384767 RepID=UPI003907EF18
MPTLQIGGTPISALTLGTVQLGIPYGIANTSGKPDKANAFRILEAATKGGVTGFDTAGSYGDAEVLLGEFFANRPDKPVLVSKMTLPLETGLSAAEIERLMDEKTESTLRRLQIGQLPVMLLHNPDVLLQHGETITRRLRKLQRDGLVAKAGVSIDGHSDEQYEQLWRIIKDDVYEALQIPLNVLDHRLIRQGAIREFAAAGKIVFARSVFLQGLLLMDEETVAERVPGAIAPLRTLRSLAEREGFTVAEAAISFVRDMPEIASLVIGAETDGQLNDTIKLMSGPAIGEELRAGIMRELGGIPASVLNPVRWPKR